MEHRAWWVLSLAGIATILCGLYAYRHLGINTDITAMLSSDLGFQRSQERLKRVFPQLTDLIVVVIEADTPEMSHMAVTVLEDRLKNHEDLIRSVYTPSGGRFFETHSLLYLDLPEIEDLSWTVAEFQPYITEFMRDKSLRGLFMILNDSYDRTGWGNTRLLGSLFLRMSEAIQSTLAGLDYTLSWHSVILKQGVASSRTVRFLLIQPELDYHKLLPAGPALQTIRHVIDEPRLRGLPGVRVRVTGEVALAHEELLIVSQRAGLAAFLALVMVCMTLFVAFRSWRLMVASLLTLLVGLAVSAGFATIAVGHLNIISVTFAVLFIGLGVDYAIHLGLRYQELLGLGEAPDQAISKSLQDVGPALILCAVTTATAFYAFVPTNYAGMSELGLISGTSMFIGLLTSLTVLPAIMTVLPARRGQRWPTVWSARDLDPMYEFPLRHGRVIRGATLLLLLLSLFLLTKATFDRNPHNLRDPHSESVSTLKDLLERGEGAPWTLTVLAPDTGGASDYAARLRQLDSAKDVRTINDFVPEHQVGKLMLFQEMAETFLSRPNGPSARSPVARPEDAIPALRAFLNRLDEFVMSGKRTNETDPAVRLRAGLLTLLTHLEGLEEQPKSRLLGRLEQSLLGSLPAEAMNTDPAHELGPFSVDDLPRELYERWVSEDGSYRIEVTPKEDLRSTIAMRNFVKDVRGIAPEATGLPVSYLDGSQEVIQAFGQAFVFAILAIIGILAIVFRNLRDALLVILPLCLAGILTGAMTVALDTPFNYANILVLPLIFGLGADCGIHIVERMRRMPTHCGDFLRSSTMRGVFFSGLTTILSFSNLAYTPHLGVSSMGGLLAMGVLFTLVATLVVLPAILYASRRPMAGE